MNYMGGKPFQMQMSVSDCLLHCKDIQLSLIYLVGAENQVVIYLN